MNLKRQESKHILPFQQKYIDDTIKYFKLKGRTVNITIIPLYDEFSKVGDCVEIWSSDSIFIEFSILSYPFCCGASILMNVNYQYTTQKEDCKIIDAYIEGYNKDKTRALCQFMSSYGQHKLLYEGLEACGWTLAYDYFNKNSGNTCYTIIKEVDCNALE